MVTDQSLISANGWHAVCTENALTIDAVVPPSLTIAGGAGARV